MAFENSGAEAKAAGWRNSSLPRLSPHHCCAWHQRNIYQVTPFGVIASTVLMLLMNRSACFTGCIILNCLSFSIRIT
jgi:hypothetical protein